MRDYRTLLEGFINVLYICVLRRVQDARQCVAGSLDCATTVCDGAAREGAYIHCTVQPYSTEKRTKPGARLEQSTRTLHYCRLWVVETVVE